MSHVSQDGPAAPSNAEPLQNDDAVLTSNGDPSLGQEENETRHVSSYGTMEPYQVTMITIGGAIHTGLMIGAGSVLTDAGPAPITISFTFVGLLVYLVLCALGEVASGSPVPTTVAGHAGRFCDPALGFTLSWIYWFKYTVVVASQLTAAALLVTFWMDAQRVNSGIWIAVFLVIIVAANYRLTPFLVTWEAALTFFKIFVVIGLVVLSVILVFSPKRPTVFLFWGVQEGHGYGETIGRLSAICESLPSATFAYLGCEMIGMTSLRTQDPCKTTARAIKLTSYRIVMFNVVSIILVAMLIPYGLINAERNAGDAALSAFVMAVQMARIPVLPHLLNACILVFTLSSAAFSLYLSTGAMYRMSLDRMAPAFLSFIDGRGVPVFALSLCSCLASLGYLNTAHDSKVVFGYLVNLVTMLSILTWISILITHLSFKRAQKAQGVPDSVLGFKAPLGQLGSWLAIAGCVVVSLTRIVVFLDHIGAGSKYHSSIMSYLGIPLYLALLFGYKLITRSRRTDPAAAGLFNRRAAAGTPEPESSDVGARTALGGHKQRVRRFARLWPL